MDTQQASFLYVGAFVDELARSGVKHVVVCPGSRSTPLALMLADEPRLKLWMHLDERSAAFFALGMAKASRRPVGLLCTSGTAAANFFPAIVEAYYSHVPLIVLTADRPPELRDTGAAQTIDQLKLYGDYAKWFVEMALPEGTPDALRYARTIACRAVSTAQAAPAGAVHLNFPFREPLVPSPIKPQYDDVDRDAYEGRAAGAPYARAVTPSQIINSAQVADLAAQLSQIERGLIIAGPQTDPELASVVAALSLALGYPLLADTLSQVRCGQHTFKFTVDSYDAFLRDSTVAERLAPNVVLHIGASPTSKVLQQYLHRHRACRHILINDGSYWQDSTHIGSDVIVANPNQFVVHLIDQLGQSQTAKHSAWVQLWRQINHASRSACVKYLLSVDELTEPRVVTEIMELVPDQTIYWLSSSMPVRDFDAFYWSSNNRVCFYSNRGVNGIDGVVSSALGAGAVSGGPLVLIIGDIAFYHDMNGLLAAKLHGLNATVILLNNDGGGIFSFLPQASHPEHFEHLFGTPHGLDFEPAARLYGAKYTCPTDWAEFRSAVKDSLNNGGLNIIEVRTERQRNVELHRAIWPKVSTAIANIK